MKPCSVQTRRFCPSGQSIRSRLSKKIVTRAVATENSIPETAEVRVLLLNQHSACVSTQRNCARGSPMQERVARFKNQFSNKRELDAFSSAASGLSTPVYYGVSALAMAAAAFAGHTAAGQAPLEGEPP